MNTSSKAIATLAAEAPKGAKLPMCVSVTWNALGRKLFAGFTDGHIRVW